MVPRKKQQRLFNIVWLLRNEACRASAALNFAAKWNEACFGGPCLETFEICIPTHIQLI